MNIYIFGSGKTNPLDYYFPFLEEKSIIISIDGGADILRRLNILPNFSVGDFDSISLDASDWLERNKVQRFSFSREKDFSDFELTAKKIIADFSPVPIHLFCMQGKRSDHFLCNLSVAENLLSNGFLPSFHSKDEDIYFMDPFHPFLGKGNIGDTVSLIPCQNSVLIHQTIGLKYSLWQERLFRNTTRGLSNELIREEFSVVVSEGQAMIICKRSE
jgi:thiamine pyrophosphokinase